MAKELIIKSPARFDPAIYYWPSENQDNNGASEIIETIKCVYEDFPELSSFFSKERLHDYDSKSYESMRMLCELYNNAIDKILDSNPSIHNRIPKKPSIMLVKHIIHQAYNQAVTDPDKLNDYEPFSPEVYGETSFEFVRQMTEEIKIKNEDVFIDLGSGVGQVVLQVAALTNVKLCIGIEKADVPANYSVGMSDAFKFWMNWYGKQFSEYHLMKGDFFSEKYRDTINNGTFIFVNNFAFGPEVDHNLKLRFAELKDGARIVSSKAFCPLNFRITDRTLSDIGSIMRVEEIQPKEKGSVSWTGKPVSYYLHEIDRRKLEEYFTNSKTPKANKTNEPEMTRNRRSSSKPHQLNNNHHSTADQSSNDSSKFNKDDSPVYGPTTRKAWSEWCKTATSAPSSSKRDPDDRSRENGNHKKPSSVTNSSLDADKLMTSDSDSCDTLVESDSNKTDSNKTDRQRTPKRTRNTASEKRLSSTRTLVNGHSDASTDSRRTPRRPKKPKANDKTKKYSDCLDLLHERTMLSISTTAANEVPIGCVNDRLSLYDAVRSQRDDQLDARNENIENVQDVPNSVDAGVDARADNPAKAVESKYENLLFNLNLDSLVEHFRNQMASFLDYMKQDEYRASILDAIEKEKKLNSELTSRIGKVEGQISEQLSKGKKLLDAKLAEIDIHAADPEELGVKARELINRNRELHNQVETMTARNQQLEEVMRDRLNRFHLVNKLEEMKNYKQAMSNNFNNLNNSLNNFRNNSSSNLSASTNSSSGGKVNSRAKKSASSKQSAPKDASSQANSHPTSNKNSHVNSQLNPMAPYADQPPAENPSLSKANPPNSFGQTTVNSQTPNYFSNQSLSNLNNLSNLGNLSSVNLNSSLNSLNGLNVPMNYDGKSSNLPNNLHSKAAPNSAGMTPSLSQTSLSSQSSLSQSSLVGNSVPASANQLTTGNGKTIHKHLDRIKEKVAKSKCNNGNNVLKNDTNLLTNNLATNSNHNASPLKPGTSRKEATKINGTTRQFPELEEDVIKSMIVAAFHDGQQEISNSLNNSSNHGPLASTINSNNSNHNNNSISSSISSINNTITSVINNAAAAAAAAATTAAIDTPAPAPATKQTKPRKPRQPRAKKDAASKNASSNGPATSHSSLDSVAKQTQNQSQSKSKLLGSQSALPYEPSPICNYIPPSTTDFSSLFKNLHNATPITSSSTSFLSSAKKASASLSSTPSSLASSSANNEPESTQGNAIKLTLKKIDRGRDSYTLVKSPESDEKSTANSIEHHTKRKGNHSDSPDHKSKKSKSPKYSSTLNAYEPEKQRLIIKLTNRN